MLIFWASVLRGPPALPSIQASTLFIPEDTEIGSVVATLTVANAESGSSGWTFVITTDEDEKFEIEGAWLLSGGFWHDNGAWNDAAVWEDS